MATKEEITEQIKARFASVRERARVLAHAMKVRAEIVAVRRRLRSACADLGEEVYSRLVRQAGATLKADATLQEFRVRIDGLHAELHQRERALAEILEGGKGAEAAADEPAVPPEPAAAPGN